MADRPRNRPKGRVAPQLAHGLGLRPSLPGPHRRRGAGPARRRGRDSGVPYAFKLIIDKGFATGAGTQRYRRWFEYLLLLVVVHGDRDSVRYYFVSWLGERTVADIRLAVHRNLLRLSPGFFEENRPAEITSRITVDTTIIEQVVGTTVSVALRNAGHGPGLRRHTVRAGAQARRHDAARGAAGHRSDRRSSAGAVRRFRRRSQDRIADVGTDHQRSAGRDEDRPGLQPGRAARRHDSPTRSSACSRPPSGASCCAR